MGVRTSTIEIVHDEAYGDDLLWHINNAFGGRDMRAERVLPGVDELIEAAKDIRDNPGADPHGYVGFCAIENPKLDRLRDALEPLDSSQ